MRAMRAMRCACTQQRGAAARSSQHKQYNCVFAYVRASSAQQNGLEKLIFRSKTLSILANTTSLVCKTLLLLTVIELEVTGKPPKSLSQLFCSTTGVFAYVRASAAQQNGLEKLIFRSKHSQYLPTQLV